MVEKVMVPSSGESITEADLAVWHKENGDIVAVDELIAELETEKASLEIRSPAAGALKLLSQSGTTVHVGDIIAEIDTSSAGKAPISEAPPSPKKVETHSNSMDAANSSASAHSAVVSHVGPAARKRMLEQGLNNLNKAESPSLELEKKEELSHSRASLPRREEPNRSIALTRIRQTIAKRLTQAQQVMALLTTFNEVDMHAIIALRKKYKEAFQEKHGVSLGFMSFFTKACALALSRFPIVHSFMGENEILEPPYTDISIAVASPRGLVTPVLRNVEKKSFQDIESGIKSFAMKAKENKLSMDDMKGGSFTITNGGVFGSMLSTPIVNYPQSSILGMHNIVQRPVAINGEVCVHPIMYIALTYDHRIIDGAQAVQFLVAIKEYIEDPNRLLFDI